MGFYSNDDYVAQRSLGYLLRRLTRLIEPRAEAVFTDQALTFSQWIALRLMRDGLADTSAKLARAMCHNSGAMTRLVDQLEERGLIERQRCANDRRVVRLTLTAAGDGAVSTLNPRIVAMWNAMLTDFSRHEVETLLGLLSRLLVRLEIDEAGQ